MYNQALRFAVLTFFLAGLLGFTTAQTAVEAFKQAEQLRKQNDCNGAVQKYNEAIRLDPSNYRFYVKKGQCELKMKSYKDALQSFNLASQYNKEYTPAYVMQAKLYIKNQDYANAIKSLNAAAEYEKDINRKIQYKLYVVKLSLKLNQQQDALRELNEAKKMAFEDPRITYTEGEVYASMNNWDAARASFEKALEHVKDQPPAQSAKYYYSLGLAYYKLGNTEKANQIWKNIDNTPYGRKVKGLTSQSTPRYYLALAQGYYKANAFEDAMEYINKAMQLQNNLSATYKLAGMIYYKKGQIAQSINSFIKAAEFEADDAKKMDIYNNLVRLQFNQADYNASLATLNKILAKNPLSAPALLMKAQTEYLLGQYANSLMSAEKAVDASPNDPNKRASYYFVVGLAAKRSGNTEKAKTAFKNAQLGVYKYAAKNELDKLMASSK